MTVPPVLDAVEEILDAAVSALAVEAARPGWDPFRVEAWILARFDLPGLAALAAAEAEARRARCRRRPSRRP